MQHNPQPNPPKDPPSYRSLPHLPDHSRLSFQDLGPCKKVAIFSVGSTVGTGVAGVAVAVTAVWLAVTAAELAALAVSAAMLLTKDKVFHYRKA